MRAGVAFGSNLGDRLVNLRAARTRLESLPKIQPPFLASAVYETEPVDCAADAGKFLNAFLEVGYFGEPPELLGHLREIEVSLGRPPRHARNAARTLDLDLLYFGDVVLETATLTLPHPQMEERRFVLEPLAEIRPQLFLPGREKSVADLLAALPAGSPLVRMVQQW